MSTALVPGHLAGRAEEGALTGPWSQHHFLLVILEDGPRDASVEGDREVEVQLHSAAAAATIGQHHTDRQVLPHHCVLGLHLRRHILSRVPGGVHIGFAAVGGCCLHCLAFCLRAWGRGIKRDVITTAEAGERSARTTGVGPRWLGLGDGTFWVFIDVGDILPRVGANGLCDDERANSFLLHVHNLEAAIILPLPVNLVAVHLLGVCAVG